MPLALAMQSHCHLVGPHRCCVISVCLFACPCRPAAAGQLLALCAGHLAAMQAAAAAAAEAFESGAVDDVNSRSPPAWQADLGAVVDSTLAVADALPAAVDATLFEPVRSALALMAQVSA